jgi:hypothetical protein
MTFTTAPDQQSDNGGTGGGSDAPQTQPGGNGGPASTTNGSATDTADKVAPVFLAASIAPLKLKSSAKLRFKLSERARVVITIERARGRKFVLAGRLTVAGVEGANVKTLTRRLGRHRLPAGTYRATLVATDTAGNRSAAKRIKFRVAP